jgi:hypothetical protein
MPGSGWRGVLHWHDMLLAPPDDEWREQCRRTERRDGQNAVGEVWEVMEVQGREDWQVWDWMGHREAEVEWGLRL